MRSIHEVFQAFLLEKPHGYYVFYLQWILGSKLTIETS
jgi:hypothetical protein